jgi:hypothetical protein
VVSIAPDRTAPPEHAVHGFRQADREALAAADEARLTFCFDEEMDVIGLDAELPQPEAPPGGGCKGFAHGFEHACAPK